MGRPAKKSSSGGENETAEERKGRPASKRQGVRVKAAATEGEETRERLRRLAYTNGVLSAVPASTSTSLPPSKAVLNNDGRDVVKKGARKNRFLFALPGLFAPLSGGKIGELADLNTKNPVLYLEFPQGRMKLFGTIIYPKSKYLTLQFAKTSKNVICEDWFENMVVFSEAWWIGTREKNPDELKLEFPEELREVKHVEYDFKGGVGAAKEGICLNKSTSEDVAFSPKAKMIDDVSEDSGPSNAKTLDDATELTPSRHSARTAGKKIKYAPKAKMIDDVSEDSVPSNAKTLDDATELTPSRHSARTAGKTIKYAPKAKMIDDVSEDSGPSNAKTLDDATELTPSRHSARTAGKTIKYADSPSGDEDIDSDSSMEAAEPNGVSQINVNKLDQQNKKNRTDDGEYDPGSPQILHSEKAQKLSSIAERSKESSKRKCELVQSTISTLFEKMDAKKSRKSITKSTTPKGSTRRVQSAISKKNSVCAEIKRSGNNQSQSGKPGTKVLGKLKQSKALDDHETHIDVEEISSGSEVPEEE